MVCESCGEKPKHTAKDFTKAVIEINNPETLVLFRKVVIPASMGDETSVPAAIGKYHNVLLVYEANNHAYLYSSDGIPTLLTSDVAQDLEEKINKVADDLQTETNTRQLADSNLSGRIDTLNHDLGVVSGNLSAEVINRTNADKTLQDNIDAEALARDNADTALDGRLTTVEGIAATAIQPADINRVVATDLALDPTISTSTVQLNESKVNLATGATSSDNVVLPVASSTQAGVMNSATFDAITNNKNNIDAFLGGSVAVTGLSASPSQSDITTAWQTETGLTTLINRATVYDVTNDKVWTYYSNDTTWHAASNTSQVTINTFTNSSEGTILGSTNTGQIFAESDGTGSVNGWDTLTGNVSTNTGNISSLQTAVAGKQDKIIAGTNITIAADGKTISATDTKYTAGNAITIDAGDNNRIDAAIHPSDFFTAGPTTTVTGSSLTLTDTLDAQFDDVKLYGDTAQQTYTGKNLFDISKVKTNSTHVVNNGDGTLTVDLTNGASGAAPNTLEDFCPQITVGDTVVLSYDSTSTINNIYLGSPASQTWAKNSSKTITQDMLDAPVIWYGGSDNTPVTYSNFQIELGSTPTAYEPYVGGVASPNPDYPQDVNVATGTQTVKVTGKNLFDRATAEENKVLAWATGLTGNETGSIVSDYIPVKTTEKLKFTYSAQVMFYDASKKYIGALQTDGTSVLPSGGGIMSFNKITVPSLDNIAYMRLGFRTSYNTGVNLLAANIQVEKGETATTYEPYEGHSYPVRLSSKNLFNSDLLSNYYVTSSNSYVSANHIGTEEYFEIKPNTNYTLSITEEMYRIFFVEYDSTKTVITQAAAADADHVSFTSQSNAKYARISFSKTGTTPMTPSDYANSVQLEESSTPTAYTPYYSYELCKIGAYQDYIYKSGDDWYVHKETGKSVLTGDEAGWFYTAANNRIATLKTNIGDMVSPTDANTAMAGLSDKFRADTMNNLLATADGCMAISTADYFNLKDTSWSDLATAKAGIAGTTVYYALATPTDTKITESTLIADLEALAAGNTYDAETNIIITANDTNLPALLKATYYRRTLEGVLETIPQAQVQADWTQVDTDAKDYIKNKPALATVATTGAYSDLIGTPTIPTVNNATLTIQKNGTTVDTFTANASSNVTANITVPVITMTDTDPGEGGALAANNFIAVYNP